MFRTLRDWLFRRITLRHWAWIHAFLALGVGWGTAMIFSPPPSYHGFVEAASIFLMGLSTLIGGLVSVVGMIMTLVDRRKIAITGLWVELVGAVLLTGGPLQYLGLQIGYIADGQTDSRYALAWFSYAMIAFMLVRFSVVIPAIIAARRADRRISA